MSSKAVEKTKFPASISQHREQAFPDGLGITRNKDTGGGQHGSMCAAARDVLRVKPLVKADRGVDGGHDRIGARGKTAAPHLVGGCGGGIGHGMGLRHDAEDDAGGSLYGLRLGGKWWQPWRAAGG